MEKEYLTDAAAIARALAASAEDMVGLKEESTGRHNALLSAYQAAEKDGVPPRMFWAHICAANGWSHKIYDESAHKMVKVDGAPSPKTAATPASWLATCFDNDPDVFRTAAVMTDVKAANKSAPASLVDRAKSAIDKVHKAGDMAGLIALMDHLESLKAKVPAGSVANAPIIAWRKQA